MRNHGNGLLKKYNNSHVRLIISIYPTYNWLPWRFNVVSETIWNDKNNQLNYMEWLSEKLNIKSKEDWYNVSHKVNN